MRLLSHTTRISHTQLNACIVLWHNAASELIKRGQKGRLINQHRVFLPVMAGNPSMVPCDGHTTFEIPQLCMAHIDSLQCIQRAFFPISRIPDEALSLSEAAPIRGWLAWKAVMNQWNQYRHLP